MGGSESKTIPANTNFFTYDHGDKYQNLWGISLGFFIAWIVLGTILAIYVYTQIDPKEPKMKSSHSW